MNLRTLRLRNQIVNGVEVAPMAACVVCGKRHPSAVLGVLKAGAPAVPGWHYIAGSVPVGAITCSERCAKQAVDRHRRTGRVDTPSMRAGGSG